MAEPASRQQHIFTDDLVQSLAGSRALVPHRLSIPALDDAVLSCSLQAQQRLTHLCATTASLHDIGIVERAPNSSDEDSDPDDDEIEDDNTLWEAFHPPTRATRRGSNTRLSLSWQQSRSTVL